MLLHVIACDHGCSHILTHIPILAIIESYRDVQMSEDNITIEQCLEENPAVLKQTLEMMKAGQKAIYDLSMKTGKEVNGTGIYWYDNNDDVPVEYVRLIRGQARSLYLSYEVTETDANPADMTEMKALIDRIEDIDHRFPDVTVEELQSLDLLNSCIA